MSEKDTNSCLSSRKAALQVDKGKIIEMYLAGKSIHQIAKSLHHGIKGIKEILVETKTKLRRPNPPLTNTKELSKCIELYRQGMNLKSICRARHHDVKLLRAALTEHGIGIHDRLYYMACKVDETYFDIIDTEVKAYFLGLLFADGTVSKDSLRIKLTLKAEDGYLVESLRAAIHCSNKICYIKSKDRSELGFGVSSPQSELAFTNKHMAQTLLSHGMDRKERFPETIPAELQHHFIRGVFDGDGCIWNGNRAPSEGLFYILAEKSLCDRFRDIFEANGCTKMESKPRKNIWQIRKSSNKTCMLNAFNYMYQDATIFMQRKHEIWKEWLTDNEFCSSSFPHII